MGVGRYCTQASTTAAALPGVASETVVLTSPLLLLPYDNCQVLIWGFYWATIGTGNTSWQCRVRQGTALTGAVVGALPAAFSVTAGNAQQVNFAVIDTAPGSGGQQYVFTINPAAATGGGANQAGMICAMVL